MERRRVAPVPSPMADAIEAHYFEPHSYAIYTRSRHEKIVAKQLGQRETVRNWKNGRFKVQIPLFPEYLFVRIPLKERLRVLQVPGVVTIVGFKGIPAPLPQAEIETIRDALSKGVHATPHPYLKVGTRVRIKGGPLEGMQGILSRKKGHLRVVVSVDLIMRSIAIDIQASDVEPIK
jgi:transcription antitermination factor NusG